ncbi:hypothetical protein K1Y72_26525 [Actinomadura sp. PM05-2]|uniref:DUF6879 domain-containing protein n=2 Tax=Actinomadura parmotrematis TaxID=2864039 RepID=A0ABS7FZT5_9ACTN|nr:DUF6879 family protein [Actinomadura parmotrematis]MBW8485959.1 hypothetical protein [Actinomadura parmotrematis]
MVRNAAGEGRTFRRVRIASLPPTDYSAYGLWFASRRIAAGEGIRYLDRARAADLPDFDYWLFDAARVVRLDFDEHDRPVRAASITEPSIVTEPAAFLNTALARSVARDEFARALGLG